MVRRKYTHLKIRSQIFFLESNKITNSYKISKLKKAFTNEGIHPIYQASSDTDEDGALPVRWTTSLQNISNQI